MLASLTCLAPAAAQSGKDKSESEAAGFGAGVAAIIAERRKGQAGSWAGLDRDRLASGFRLTSKTQSAPRVAGPPDGPLAPSAAPGMLSHRQQAAPSPAAPSHAPARRGVSFGIDGLPDLDGSEGAAEPAPVRPAGEGLPQSRACEALMPGMACTALAAASGGPRLALAYNF